MSRSVAVIIRAFVASVVATAGVASMSHCSKGSSTACGNGAGDSSETCRASSNGFDFIVVGSGAGGGPLAARLARANKRVLLVEAGTDVGEKLRYRVPAMHALSTEDRDMAWWYFAKHHADDAVEASDSKSTSASAKEGTLYPRGSALGGSTAVNALVTVLPSSSDWNRLAELTGDKTFRATSMARYYARVREWLSVEIPDPALALGDAKVSGFLRAAAEAHSSQGAEHPPATETTSSLATLLSHDLNAALERGETTGLYRLPLATSSGVRNGPREHLLRTVAEGYPLTIMTGTLVTRVLWGEKPNRSGEPIAVGVEVLRQSHVYRASLEPERVSEPRESLFVRESGEVILSAGTFNSPQLLGLSGVGDRAALGKIGIDAVADRRAVGENLQDRYEAAVVSELEAPLDVLGGCELGKDLGEDDPCIDEWKNGRGVYTTPGFLATVLRRSTASDGLADLQVFAVPTDARGYYPGYSADSARAKNRFSWLLLKGHTQNRDGTVRLVDGDPLSRPSIHFRSYDEKAPLQDPDLLAMVEGVKFVRDITRRARAIVAPSSIEEVWPGANVASDADLARFVRKETWGHHACCSNKMGAADDDTAVVDPEFRVIGTDRLRVVDASVFPEIPGTFIALPTFMLAEKAADVILGQGARGVR